MIKELASSPRVAPFAKLASIFVSMLTTIWISSYLANSVAPPAGLLETMFPELSYLEPMLSIFASIPGAAALIAVVWLHEIGHTKAMGVFRIKVIGPVLFLPFGGLVVPERPLAKREAFFVYLAGPLTGLVSIPLAVWGRAVDHGGLVGLAFLLAIVNLLNLTPVYGLDGYGMLISITSAWPKRLSGKINHIFPAVLLLGLLLVILVTKPTALLLLGLLLAAMVPFLWLDKILTKVLSEPDKTEPSKERPINMGDSAGMIVISILLVSGLVTGTVLSLAYLL